MSPERQRCRSCCYGVVRCARVSRASTNVCSAVCDFCAFYRAPKDPEGYIIEREVLLEKIAELVAEVVAVVAKDESIIGNPMIYQTENNRSIAGLIATNIAGFADSMSNQGANSQ